MSGKLRDAGIGINDFNGWGTCPKRVTIFREFVQKILVFRGVPYGNGPGNEATARLAVVVMINMQ